MAKTYNKNEQYQGTKNNAELWTKCKKTNWKIFEENVRRGRNRSIMVYQLVTYDDDDDVMIYSTLYFCNFFLWLNGIALNGPGGTETCS